jgi:predicted ChrR family anti-sigma factor
LNHPGMENFVLQECPLDAFLAAFTAKTLSSPLAALVAAHLELRLDNRAYVAALEAAHGVFLEELEPVPLVGRDRRLVNIFASQDADVEKAAHARAGAGDVLMPPALRRFAGCDYADLPWQPRLPGIDEAAVAQDEFSVASFIRGRPGIQLPMETHDDLKVALLLGGSFTDANGHHERGDIVFIDSGNVSTVGSDTDCICFVVSEGRAKPSGALGLVLQRVIG